MIRRLFDRAGLVFTRVSEPSDCSWTADEFYYVVDLRPTEFAIPVETERFLNRRIL